MVASIDLAVLLAHHARGDWRIEDGSALSALASLTLVNVAAAVLIRQQNVLNVLFGIAGPARGRGPCGCGGASPR